MESKAIDNLKNQYPHLSEQEIANVIAGLEATNHIHNYYPQPKVKFNAATIKARKKLVKKKTSLYKKVNKKG